MSVGRAPFGGSSGESIPCLFQLVEATGVPWPMDAFLDFLLSTAHGLVPNFDRL